MRVSLFNISSRRIDEDATQYCLVVSGAMEDGQILRFFGTEDMIVATWVKVFPPTRLAEILRRYNEVAEMPIVKGDLCVAGDLMFFSVATITDWDDPGLGVQTRKDLLDKVMEALFVTAEGHTALVYRRS